MVDLAKIKEVLMSESALALFRDNLPSATGKHAAELAERYAKMVYTAVTQNPTLGQCSVQSIVKSASISASLGLDIDPRGFAYLVPYKNKGRLEAQFQIGYMGLIELAYRSGKVKCISAHVIRVSEVDNVVITRTDGRYKVIHPFSFEPPTGEIIAVYATAEVEGYGSQTTVLRKDEVEKFRKKSKAPNSPAWKDFYDAMAKKTAIRQLAKFLPKSIMEDFTKAAAIDERESYAETTETVKERIEAETGKEVIDAEPEPVEDEASELEPEEAGEFDM